MANITFILFLITSLKVVQMTSNFYKLLIKLNKTQD